MTARQRLGLAYHEAGHAVGLHRFGHYFTQVTIRPHGTMQGHVEVPRFLVESAQRSPSQQIEDALIALMGPLSEARAVGDIDDSGSDFEMAVACCAERPRLTIEKLQTEAARVLDECWPQVETIAVALLARGSLYAESVAVLLDDRSGG